MKKIKKLIALIMVFAMVFTVLGAAQPFNEAEETPSLGVSIVENVSIHLNLLYDNVYHEAVLIPNEDLTIEIDIHNRTIGTINPALIIAEFSAGRFAGGITLPLNPINSGGTLSFDDDFTMPSNDVDEVRIMLWNGMSFMTPLINTIILTPEPGNNFFGNNFNSATLVTIDRPIDGRINPAGDVDYLKFTVPTDGVYRISTTGMNLALQLFFENEEIPAAPDSNGNMLFYLETGETYFLRLAAETSGAAGRYTVNIESAPNTVVQQFNVRAGDYVSIPVSARNISSTVEYFVIYNAENFELVNAREEVTTAPILNTGVVTGTNLNITGITPNSISFRNTINAGADVVNTVRLRARRAGRFAVATYTHGAMPTSIMLEDLYINDISQYNILTYTLSEPLGMQGFFGEYAITSDYEMIEIYVQFITPSAVALRLIHQRGNNDEDLVSENVFIAQAMTGHNRFQQQLAGLPAPFSASNEMEIIDEMYWLFNGWLMNVPGGMVELIAGLPEVYSVFPNITFYDTDTRYALTENQYYATSYSTTYVPIQTMPSSAQSREIMTVQATYPFFVRPDIFMRTVRDFFDMTYINRDMEINGITGVTGRGVQVAVLDAGIYHNHQEFERFRVNGRVRGGHTTVAGGIITNDARRDHGTTVTGAVIGIAPNVELWHYFRDYNLIGALDTAHRDGAQIINMSFGATATTHPFSSHILRVTSLAAEDGVVMIAAAGNSGQGEILGNVASPGNVPIGIGVGAGQAGGTAAPTINANGTNDIMRSYSSRGPVRETYHIKPDIVAPAGVRTTNWLGDYSASSGGTSFAAPIMAGIAALILEAYPDAEPWEVRARIMNSARPMLGSGANNVYISGAGFVQPYYALRADTIVTVEHYVPVSNNRAIPFERHTMASLSFGSVSPRDNVMPMRIENRSNAERTYTITHTFTNFPTNTNNAQLTFSNQSVTIPAGSERQIDVTLGFGNNPPLGFYEGHIFVSTGGTQVARLPFAANLTENNSLAVTTTSPYVAFNGTRFALNEIYLSSISAFQGSNVRVVINLRANDSDNIMATYTRLVPINAVGNISIRAVHPFMHDFLANQHIEILVYKGNLRQHILSRHIVRPVVF